MPVRIYDISKKLGLENKMILAKAKALGIAAAKVPSSSLDKISAQFLEEELFKEHPDLAAKFAAPPVVEKPKPPPVEEKIVLITAPPPEPKPEVRVEPVNAAAAPPFAVEAPPPPPPPPPKPAGPRLGEKVGFIQLPQRPAPRVPSHAKPAPRPASTGTTHFTRSGRPGARPPHRNLPLARPARPPRRRPNLSRRKPAKSLSSSRRSSCANWPFSSSRSRSRSSPI